MNKHGTNMTEKVPVDIGTRSEVQAFENRRIPHDSYSIAFNRAWSLATRGHSSRVVIVTGPTGVGKSTLGTSLLKYVQRAHEADLAANSSLIPAVLVKTIAHHGRSFSWKDFYVRSLEQLRDPLVERKVWSPMQMTLLGPEIRGRTGADTIDIDVLRRSLESATAHRKTRIMIVDEAHHMLCGDTPLNEVRAMVGKQPREIVAERMRRIYGIPADAPIAVPGGAEAAGPKATGKRALPPGQRLPIRDRVAGPTRGSIL